MPSKHKHTLMHTTACKLACAKKQLKHTPKTEKKTLTPNQSNNACRQAVHENTTTQRRKTGLECQEEITGEGNKGVGTDELVGDVTKGSTGRCTCHGGHEGN